MKAASVHQLNYFGPSLTKRELQAVLKSESKNHNKEYNKFFLENFFEIPLNALSEATWDRYLKITTKVHIFAAPHSKKLERELLQPLKMAKKYYCMGDYMSAIALCGAASEVISIFVWKYSKKEIDSLILDLESEKILFGMEFSKLDQKKRISILERFGPVNKGQAKELNDIRGQRNQYLHLWDQKKSGNEENDAFQTVKKTFEIFDELLCLQLHSDGDGMTTSSIVLKYYEAVNAINQIK